MSDFTGLSISGRLATPSDPDWDEARGAWNLAADQNPTAVALVESADDVAKTVRFASENDLRVAGQGTGHGAVALEPLEDTILIKTERMLGACIGDQASGETTIAPLRELGEPIMDTFGQMPAAGLCRIHMDPEQPVPGLGHHQVLHELPDEAVAAFTRMAGPDSGSPLLLTEIRQLGGALGRPDPNGGALTHLDAPCVLFAVGLPMAPEMVQAIESHLDATAEAMEPWAADGGYFNFAERPCDVDEILPADTCKRLAQVKRSWDPDNLIQANHSIALAPA